MPTYPNTFSSYNGQSRASTSNLLARYSALSITKLLILGVGNLPLLRAAPTYLSPFIKTTTETQPSPAQGPALWIYLSVAVVLVLLGGAFAGLTIALMGQDEIYLQVIEKSGEGYEKKHAAKVLRLLQRGKHWVLVTLLLGNVITNETLPIVLDRSLGGGWPAVLGSTALIVIFGEIIPQSICVRYGLPIGAYMSPLVQFLMYLLAPVAWPTAKLLDRLLGQDHGTTYKKAGLKTLVTLHKTLGAAGEQLNSDEVTIISAVLDLKAKSVGSIMTPMEDVFTMSADTVLDEATMDIILSAGYSRIPIYAPQNPKNFVGMLLVKILITYDPEDCKRVRDFALATLPETRADTSCLDIVNFFQEGKSHMVLVSEFPGEDKGALGVVTLEDVIEELIGEEIIDESDVFIDVHKAIRRLNPAPRYRVPKGEVFAPSQREQNVIVEEDLAVFEDKQNNKPESERRTSDTEALKVNRAHPDQNGIPAKGSSPRRASSTMGGSDREGPLHRSVNAETLEHLKHLGPSNVASRPRQTRFQTVKIKPGADSGLKASLPSIPAKHLPVFAAARGENGPGHATSGKSATDEVLNVQASYGTMDSPSKTSNNNAQSQEQSKDRPALRDPKADRSGSFSRTASAGSDSTAASLPKHDNSSEPFYLKKKTNNVARSGSITENIVDAGGIKKTVLETTSSSSDIEEDDEEDAGAPGEEISTNSMAGGGHDANDENVAESRPRGTGGRKKRRRRKRKPSAIGEEEEEEEAGPGEENQRLLG